MPSGLADWGADTWAQALFGVIDLPTEYWVALLSDEPGPGSDGDIVTDLEPDVELNYARQHYGTGPGSWVSNSGYLTSVVDIDWGLPFGDWGRITHYALLDSYTGGNLYAWGELSEPQYVTESFQLSIPAGGLIVELGTIQNSIVY